MIGAAVCLVLAATCAAACVLTWLALRNDVPQHPPAVAEALRALERQQQHGTCHCQACGTADRRWRSVRQRLAG